MQNDNIIILETYPSNEGPYDGLSGFFDEVKDLGVIMDDTSNIAGAKVLVMGVAPLYANKISELNTNIVFTTFESDEIPQHWVSAINNYDYCIVPHKEIVTVFERSGVTIPVSVIHQGYSRFARTAIRDRPVKEFNVGFLGIPVNRKNLMKLYTACKILQQESIPDIRLHVHVSFFYDWLDESPFLQLKNDDMVVWTCGKYDASQISAWYHRLSCYVFPSSGEGWSYTPRESLYLGIPTIITDIPVHRELTDSGFCKVINTSGREAADFHGSFHGTWARIEVHEIREAISDVYNRYDFFSRQAQQGSVWMEDKWLNQDIKLHLLEFINSI